MASFISFADFPGFACHKQAVIPATIGQEKDVPLPVTIPPALARTALNAWATTSGLMRLSAEGPTELKLIRFPEESTPPIASTFFPSAGAIIYLQPPLPSLPALF